MMRDRIPSLAVVALAVVIAGGLGREANAYDAERAARVYDTYCAQCHGLSRNGKGVNSVGLSVQPRDHTDAKSMGDMSDEHIFKAIKEGGLGINKSILMPAWKGVLSDGQIRDLVRYLREVCRCGGAK